MSRLKIVILVFCAGAAGGISVWLPMADSDHQKRVKEFFGPGREYDLKGGQGMRPPW